jgi:tetratricopeptide (TPR) repeat protein
MAAVLACLMAATAYAEEPSAVDVPQTQNPYIRAVATLYRQGKCEEALSKLEKALETKGNGTPEVLWLKLMKGVLQAELAQGAALESFKEALALDEKAQLPVKATRRLLKLFEQARNTAGLPTDAELLAEEQGLARGPPPRRYRASVEVRGEVDVLNVTNGFTTVWGLGYTGESRGGVLSVVVQSSPGLRAEGQYHPLTLAWVRPYARLGTTAFFLSGGVSGRAALGVDVKWSSHMSAFADVAYERFFTGGERYRSESVLFSLGVGLFP